VTVLFEHHSILAKTADIFFLFWLHRLYNFTYKEYSRRGANVLLSHLALFHKNKSRITGLVEQNTCCFWVTAVTHSSFTEIGLFFSILICIQQDATLHRLFYLETALHVSGGTITHHQERKQLYLQHLVFVTLLLLSAAIVEELEPV